VKRSSAKQLTPTVLRNLLATGIVLLFALGIGLFWLTYSQLQTYSKEVSAKNSEAIASNDSLSRLQATKGFLDNNTALIDQLNLFTLNRDLPQFQIRNDILHYAQLRNLSPTSIELGSGDAGAATTPATPGAAPSSNPTTTPPVVTSGSGSGNQLAATVTFAEDVEYAALLRFLYDIEHNLPKMTIEKVVLSQGEDSNAVKVEPLVIKTHITK